VSALVSSEIKGRGGWLKGRAEKAGAEHCSPEGQWSADGFFREWKWDVRLDSLLARYLLLWLKRKRGRESTHPRVELTAPRAEPQAC